MVVDSITNTPGPDQATSKPDTTNSLSAQVAEVLVDELSKLDMSRAMTTLNLELLAIA